MIVRRCPADISAYKYRRTVQTNVFSVLRNASATKTAFYYFFSVGKRYFRTKIVQIRMGDAPRRRILNCKKAIYYRFFFAGKFKTVFPVAESCRNIQNNFSYGFFGDHRYPSVAVFVGVYFYSLIIYKSNSFVPSLRKIIFRYNNFLRL